ncbi:MAG: chromosome segregation protein SMC [Ruminococcaceae bacterium]|nr:chromosome segregation protein SMC [Oscillospiraceae bacterium]
MHLKGLKMQGFKSFADTIELSFSEGITAIVGPNGSGKSNISDAVRWVLGEQSAKTLRGSKMEDVIFNGTQTRKRLGFAEVTLKLDNHDRHFNVDFDEVSVTRKVFASGESQYLINDTPCRLKDIHEIFMDTGLGRDGYSMVGQGKIDEILSNKSEDRREIFEEAAGISKYRYRKEEAERKLKHTDENLDRVADIIGELEVQIGPLTQQAEKAKKYLNLKDELKVFDVNSALRVVERSKTQTVVLNEKIEAAAAHLAKVEEELSKAEGAQEQCYKRFEELAEAMAEQEAALKTAEEGSVIGLREIEVLKNTIEGNLRLSERIYAEIANLSAVKQELSESLRKEEARIKDLEASLETLQKEKDALSENLSEFDEGAGNQSEQIEALQNAISEAFEKVSDSKIQLSNLTLLEQNIKTRRQELSALYSQREKELAEQEQKGGSLDSEHERKTEFVAELEKQLEALSAQEKELQSRLDAQTAKETELQHSINQKKTRHHLLLEMEQNFEGYYKSVKEIMKQHQNGVLKGIHGPVSKLISVDKPYATAIGVAVGGALQNVVVDSENDAKKAINLLKQQGAGRATFMPISAVSGTVMDTSKLRHEPGFVGVASELVSFDSRYEGVVKNLLGKTAIIDTIDNAISISRKYKQSLRLVTLEGEAFYPGGSMAGGSQQKGNQLLDREQEIKELEKALKQLEGSLKQISREREALEAQILDVSEQQAKVSEVYHENKEVLLLLIRDREHHELLLTSLRGALSDIQKDMEEAETEAASLDGRRQEAAKQLEQAEADIQEKRAQVNALEETLETFSNRKQKINDQILEKGFQMTVCRQDIEQCKEKMVNIRQEMEQNETHTALRSDEIKEIEQTNEGHKREIADKEKKNEEFSANIQTFKNNIVSITQERQNCEKQLKNLQGDSKATRETAYDLKTEYSRLTSQLEKLEAESETAVSRLWEEYEMTFSEAERLKRDDLGTDSEIARKISSLRGRIRELGNVNVDAIEELKSVSERFEFLTRQRDDLHKAKRDLLKIIDEMQTVMKRQFREQFDKINKHFKTTFSELFGGGNADLILEDEENILECGISIHVQPPGKKLQSLSLLSGGERALSAIALLFAILRIKPTPFCFLDEIEAALDENNVYRYADFIKRFSRKTQFILVTHRRGTMESADVIYGVTMQEKGVSKLLQLNLDEIEA